MESKSEGYSLDQLFSTCDTDGNGKIVPHEFQIMCNKLGISESDANVIFQDLDHDGDGEIDFNEFSHGFRDFLMPGSRRGSLQVNSMESSTAEKKLQDMEKRHAVAKPAWRHFVHNVGPTNLQYFLNHCGEQLHDIAEDMKNENEGQSQHKLEKALSDLIGDVQLLQDEYRSLENTFKKEREAHAMQLAVLGEELDLQLAKTEAKVKQEARVEAQKQMDAERKKIVLEMESQLSELSAQIRTFQKVEQWLLDEESRGRKSEYSSMDSAKLSEAEMENRNLRSELVEAQMKATLLQTQLSQKRKEYVDLCEELRTEKMAAHEFRNQCDYMQNHLSVLSETNRALSDATEYFPSLHKEIHCSTSHESKNSHCCASDISLTTLKTPAQVTETDKDSGRETLLDELRAENEGSPLPSGIWSKRAAYNDEILTRKSPSSSSENNNDILDTKKSTSQPILSESSSNGNGSMPLRTFKVILAGDSSVGKTTFIERACNDRFTPNLSSTIGVDFRMKSIEADGRCVALQLWDTAGQERFRSLTKSYFRRADGVILMYDVTNERTFLSIRQWLQCIEEGAGRRVPVVLCGNKVDLREAYYKGSSCVSTEEGAKLGKQSCVGFMETSPKTGYKVNEVLVFLAKEMSEAEDEEVKNCLKLVEPSEKRKSCCGGNASSNSKTN